MIAPEQWYEYQQQYQKYGLDMKPQESREHREKRREAAKQRAGIEVSIRRDYKALMLLLLAAAVVVILFIVTNAYAASVRYEIGQVETENAQLWDEIKNLQSSESTKNGVGYVEKRAKKARKVEQRNLKTKRKAAKASRKAQRGINRERVKTINEERLEANRNRALLSDAELNRRIARLQKERQLNQLTQEELQPGRTAVKRALTNAGTETLKGETKSLIKKGKKRATKVAANKVSFGVRGPHVGSASRVHIE